MPRELIPSLQKSLGSNINAVLLSMSIFTPPQKKWNLQQRIPSLISPRIKAERANRESHLKQLQISGNLRPRAAAFEGPKTFLVVRKLAGVFAPIGFRKSFTNKIDLMQFAREQGRAKVKLGIITYDVEKELSKILNPNIKNNKVEVKVEETPIKFIKNGRGKTLWNAKRADINGFGKTKIEAEKDLINSEISIAAIRNF